MNRADAQSAVSELVEELATEELGLSREESYAVEQHIMARRDYPLLYLAPAVQEARYAERTLLDDGDRDRGRRVDEAELELVAVARELVREAVEDTDGVEL
jgi:hypothetical protein